MNDTEVDSMLLQPTYNENFTITSLVTAAPTILALEGWYVTWEAAAVNGRGWLYKEMWWRRGWRHERGFWLCWEKPEFLAADVEASRADEGAALSGRTWAGCNWTSYWRSWGGARRWRAAPRLQWKVICMKEGSKIMSTKCSERVRSCFKYRDHKSTGVSVPEGGESLYCEAGLLPLNR